MPRAILTCRDCGAQGNANISVHEMACQRCDATLCENCVFLIRATWYPEGALWLCEHCAKQRVTPMVYLSSLLRWFRETWYREMIG
jgi:hypothetical protein